MRGKILTPEEEIRYLKSRVNYWESRIVEISKQNAKFERENYELREAVILWWETQDDPEPEYALGRLAEKLIKAVEAGKE